MPGVGRVLESHGVNQKFVHMRTNFSVYRDEMNQGRISKYGNTPGVGLLSAIPALIRSRIHSRKLFSHCVCSVFMRVATH
jgi:hypothetical protein